MLPKTVHYTPRKAPLGPVDLFCSAHNIHINTFQSNISFLHLLQYRWLVFNLQSTINTKLFFSRYCSLAIHPPFCCCMHLTGWRRNHIVSFQTGIVSAISYFPRGFHLLKSPFHWHCTDVSPPSVQVPCGLLDGVALCFCGTSITVMEEHLTQVENGCNSSAVFFYVPLKFLQANKSNLKQIRQNYMLLENREPFLPKK